MDPRRMEKRRFQRAHVRFVVSYASLPSGSESFEHDVSQTKDLSSGGMLLSTRRVFPPNTRLSIKLRLPARINPIDIAGQVIDSRHTNAQVFDTRVQFVQVPEADRQTLSETVKYFLFKEQRPN